MLLQGNLQDISFTQLINVISLSNKTGTLTIYEAESDTVESAFASLDFYRGRLVSAWHSRMDNHLIRTLQRYDKLGEKQARHLRNGKWADERNDKALALRLISARYVTRRDVINSLKQQIVHVVHNLLTYKSGNYRFADRGLSNSRKVFAPIDWNTARSQAQTLLEQDIKASQEIASLDVKLRLTKKLKVNYKNIQLSADEWKVVACITPKTRIWQIMDVLHMKEHEIKEVVYRLMLAGYVEMIGTPAKPSVDETQPIKIQVVRETMQPKRITQLVRTLAGAVPN